MDIKKKELIIGKKYTLDSNNKVYMKIYVVVGGMTADGLQLQFKVVVFNGKEIIVNLDMLFSPFDNGRQIFKIGAEESNHKDLLLGWEYYLISY